MADALTFDIRLRLEGPEGARGAPDPGDPRDAIDRDRRLAGGGAAPPRAPMTPEEEFWAIGTEDEVVYPPPRPYRPKDLKPPLPPRRPEAGDAQEMSDLRDEMILIGRRVEELEAPPDPADAWARRAWGTRRRVSAIIQAREGLDDEAAQKVVEEMREKLEWLDAQFGEDFERLGLGGRGGGGGGGGLAGALGDAGGHLGTAATFLRNPLAAAATVGSRIAAGLPGGPVGIAAATVAAVATAVAPMIIQQLAQKGWPLNRDWRRSVTEEVNGAMDLRQQEDRLAGRDTFIVARAQGFGTVDGTNVVNSLLRRDELRINMRTQAEQAIGGFY